MKKATRNTIAGAATLVAAATGTYMLQDEPRYTTYIHGSAAVPHDIYFGMKVDSNIKFGLYCRGGTDALSKANQGDVVISMRANSASCTYNSKMAKTIAIVGWNNDETFIGNVKIQNALSISNGANYGKAIDYYIPGSSLSAAMPAMANIVLTINNARIDAGLQALSTNGIREVLDSSSTETQIVNGKYYGQVIDVGMAVALALTPPAACDTCKFIQAIYLLLAES